MFLFCMLCLEKFPITAVVWRFILPRSLYFIFMHTRFYAQLRTLKNFIELSIFLFSKLLQWTPSILFFFFTRIFYAAFRLSFSLFMWSFFFALRGVKVRCNFMCWVSCHSPTSSSSIWPYARSYMCYIVLNNFQELTKKINFDGNKPRNV